MAENLSKMTRRSLVAVAGMATTALASTASAQAPPTPATPKEADYLFVQSAKGMTFDKTKSALTLTGVSPVTVFSPIARSELLGT